MNFCPLWWAGKVIFDGFCFLRKSENLRLNWWCVGLTFLPVTGAGVPNDTPAATSLATVLGSATGSFDALEISLRTVASLVPIAVPIARVDMSISRV